MAVNEVAPGTGDIVLTVPVVVASTPWFVNDITRQTNDAQTILDLRAQLNTAPSAK